MENLDLSPAQWIWWPSERTLSNTVVLFRKVIELPSAPTSAKGWICADSRYRLFVNGQRVQWGPSPGDPRHLEADPLDLTKLLKPGKNIIAVEVLHFGQGDGTWPFGKPGFIFNLLVDDLLIVSNDTWRCLVDRGRPPGQHRRSYLRAWQEVHNFRLSPIGWTEVGFDESSWRAPRTIDCGGARSPISSSYLAYQDDTWMADTSSSTLRPRSVPLMAEAVVTLDPVEAHRLTWSGPVDDWFDFRTPGLYKANPEKTVTLIPTQPSGQSFAQTYDIGVEKIGFPMVTIEGPAGTIVEVICHESKAPGQSLLDTHIFSWTRYILRGGLQTLEPLDYEAAKFVQVHVHGNSEEVKIGQVQFRTRELPFSHQPDIKVSDPLLQKVIGADLQTVRNSCQDNVVDGMGRERQQYSGDCTHQLHVARLLFGDARPSARFLRTFVLGQISSGVWCDSWPAVDRLNRLWQKEMGLSYWGPIVDHSIGFLTDHVNHLIETGDSSPFKENWPSICKFLDFCRQHTGSNGLLPAEGIGSCTVWIDHVAFKNQSERVSALNIYLAYALELLALVRQSVTSGRYTNQELTDWSKQIVVALKREYGAQGLVWARKPDGSDPGWLDDRSLSTACLQRNDPASLKVLEDKAPNLGESYPANAYWPYRVRAEQGSLAKLFHEINDKWGSMVSVQKNGTVQEFWTVEEGTTALMSHCAVAPLAAVIWGLFGLHPRLDKGEYSINPRLGGLDHWEGTLHLGSRPLHIRAWKDGQTGKAEVIAPTGLNGLHRRDNTKLKPGEKSMLSIPLD